MNEPRGRDRPPRRRSFLRLYYLHIYRRVLRGFASAPYTHIYTQAYLYSERETCGPRAAKDREKQHVSARSPCAYIGIYTAQSIGESSAR